DQVHVWRKGVDRIPRGRRSAGRGVDCSCSLIGYSCICQQGQLCLSIDPMPGSREPRLPYRRTPELRIGAVVISALPLAPIALVSALRETSIVFAVLIGTPVTLSGTARSQAWWVAVLV